MTLPAFISPEGRGAGPVRLLLAAAALIFLGYVLATGSYLVTVLGFAAIYVVFVSGLNFFMGYAGQVSFGQNAFAALGGYTSAVLTTSHGWEPLPALLLGAGMSALLAFAVGFPTLRLKGHYLAMATLALGLIAYEIAVEWQAVTQGYMGISGIPALGIGRIELADQRQQFLALLVLVALTLWITHRLKHSRFGRAVLALAGIKVFAVRKDYLKAFYSSCLTILTVTFTGVIGLYPNLIPSNLDPKYSLTIFNSSSSLYTLKIMTVVALLFVPIVMAYQIWIYRIFRHGPTAEELAKEKGAY